MSPTVATQDETAGAVYLNGVKMIPVPHGTDRSPLVCQPFFVGGRRDGQLAPPEHHPFRRTYQGIPINNDQQCPDGPYYLLFRNANNYLYTYIYTDCLPADYEPLAAG